MNSIPRRTPPISQPVSGRSAAFARSVCVGAAAFGVWAAGLAHAQGPEKHSDGPFVAVPHGLSIDPSTSTVVDDESRVLIKRIGYYDDGTPGGKPGDYVVPAPGMPDYRMSLILQGVTGLDVDAFSIGLDWVLSDGDGELFVPPGHWGGITFSVNRDSEGMPGSVIRREHDDPTGQEAGGDLFFYIFPGSFPLPPGLVDETFHIQDPREMDIEEAGAPDTPEMDAHDLYVSALYQDNPSLTALLPTEVTTPRAFFSVTSATASTVPVAWRGGSAASGATIYMSEWIGGTWTTPTPFRTFTDLTLAVDEEVDAIAVDLVREEMLFSTKTASRDEILWVSLAPAVVGGDGPVLRIYRMPDQTPISEKAKTLGTDDIDAICALDPGADDLHRSFLPTPSQNLPFLTPPESWVSVFRTESPSGTSYISTLVGWPQPGRQPGLSGCWIVFPGFSPLMTIANQQRNIGSIWLGDPREAQITIPAVHPLFGFDLDFQWLVIDQATLQFDVPYSSRIML